MRKRELVRFERLLLLKRDELLKEMGLLKNLTLDTTTKEATGDHSSYSFHMADQGTDAMEREKAFLFASKTGRLLYHINEALRRIQDNSYGRCAKCGRNISPQRLLAVPHARYCIECKEQEEMEKANSVRKK